MDTSRLDHIPGKSATQDISKGVQLCRDRFLVLILALVSVIVCPDRTAAVTDHIYFIVNGDTSLSTMTQFDNLRWAANYDTGSSVHWDIWYDRNLNAQVDPDYDVIIESYNATDGDVFTRFDFFYDQYSYADDPFDVTGADDNSSRDGWYRSPVRSDGLAPGDYIFKATDLNDSTSSQRILTVLPLAHPVNTFRGRLVLPDATTAASGRLARSMVRVLMLCAEGDSIGDSYGLADSSGEFEVLSNVPDPPCAVYVSPPPIPGYSSYSAYLSGASYDTGGVELSDMIYELPQDSIYGALIDDFGQPIQSTNWFTRYDRKICRADEGSYAFYFTFNGGIINYFSEPRVMPENLFPSYMWPFESHRSDVGGSYRHDIVCPRADACIYFTILENGELPTNQYLIYAYSDSLWATAATVSGFGTDNHATLHVTSREDVDLTVGFGGRYSAYPYPDSIFPDMIPAEPQAGDSVVLNWSHMFEVRGSLVADPLDDPSGPLWGIVSAKSSNPLGSCSRTVSEGSEKYRTLSAPGSTKISVSAAGYLARPYRLTADINGDTTGGLDFVLNRAGWTVTGRIPPPYDGVSPGVVARTGEGEEGYATSDYATGFNNEYSLGLCDGQWTIEAQKFEGYVTPEPVTLTIGNDTGTITGVDFVYLPVTDVEDEDDNAPLPSGFSLRQNYPNPFNPGTTIEFTVPERSTVTVVVYNVLGQRVRTLLDRVLPAGNHTVEWDGLNDFGRGLASGVYLCRLISGGESLTTKMVLMK
jgi:hypothetical protein